jgi:dolichol kinase
MLHELIGIAYITSGALGVLALAELLQHHTSISGELSRKIAHAGCGIVLLLIPLVIDSHWSVLLLSSGFAALMLVTRMHGLLRGVHGVSRGPGGVLAYPIAAWLAYWMAYDLLGTGYTVYAIPIAILAFADAAGALVGSRWGRHRYGVTATHSRSLEGSVAVWIVAWLCVAAGLVLAGGNGIGYIMLLATALALTATMLETVSVGGLDNIVLPIGTLLLLDHLLPMENWEIAREIGLLGVCSIVVTAATWRRSAPVGGTTSIALSLYLVWSVGGAQWVTPAAATLAVFAGVQRLTRTQTPAEDDSTQLSVMIAVLAIPVALAITAHVVGFRQLERMMYVAYLASLGCTSATLLYIMPQHHRFRWRRVRRVIATHSPWSYTPTCGKVTLAVIGAAIPILAVEMVWTALTCAVIGLVVFVVLASLLARSHRICSVCGSVDIRGATCCRGTSWLTPAASMQASRGAGSAVITPTRYAPSIGETLLITQVMTAAGAALVVAWLAS